MASRVLWLAFSLVLVSTSRPTSSSSLVAVQAFSFVRPPIRTLPGQLQAKASEQNAPYNVSEARPPSINKLRLMRVEAELQKTARLTKQAKATLLMKTVRMKAAMRRAALASRHASQAQLDQEEASSERARIAQQKAEEDVKRAAQKATEAMQRVSREAEKAQRSLLSARLHMKAHEREELEQAEAEASLVARARLVEKAQRSLLEARLEMKARRQSSLANVVWEELLSAAEASASDGTLPPKEPIVKEERPATPVKPKYEEPKYEAPEEQEELAPENKEKKDDVKEAQRVILSYFDEEKRQWALQNDFYSFLNQVSVQTFVFLLNSMRDPQTVLWMENFTDPAIAGLDQPDLDMMPTDVDMPTAGASHDCKLLNYHGLNAINTTLFPTWDAYFEKLLEQPIQTYTVESEYAQVPDYDLDIHPTRLCTRLLAVREQVAREFVNDLKVLSEMSNQTIVSYWDSMKEESEDKNNDIDARDGRDLKIEEGNLMFLSLSIHNGQSPSPLRKGNFDLLKLLATQEAVHRVLNDPERQEGPPAVSNRFLAEFYAERIVTYFDGNQNYGVADKFLQELLAEPPVLQELEGNTALIDPVRLAGMILQARENVAMEWRTLAAMVPDEHLGIRRLQLSQQIVGTAAPGMSFEEALRAGSSQVEESGASVPFPTTPAPNEVIENIIKEEPPVPVASFQFNVTSVFE
eukprot:CAMPEP_0172473162 /NCGR_PEP_ID=MMETSP1065-20121228/68715_1 /TAXON_ID=265537 /ORGANISM="Amphiprora paludosa, Strain CCMP125" /LENGTH=694 /DNA_ID=CAMNT_0013231331 /DNA_START=154 /DNA_END=2238 /DNA_ORIENTATION=-